MHKFEKLAVICNLYWSGMCGMMAIKNVVENNAFPAVIFVLCSLFSMYMGNYCMKTKE